MSHHNRPFPATDTKLDELLQELQRLQGSAWAYRSATLTSGSLELSGRMVSLRVYAHGGGGSFSINGGDEITVREGIGVDLSPINPPEDPTIEWISGTLDVLAEVSQ